MRLLRKQNGDTIVEVLIAMAVVSSVLGGAYAVANHTMANSRQAQEHSEALQIANKQIEYIAYHSANGDGGTLNTPTPTYKCLSQADGQVVDQGGMNAQSISKSKTNRLPQANYAPQCVTSTAVPYYVAYTYNPTSRVYAVYVTWESVTGSGNDQLRVLYKAYQ